MPHASAEFFEHLSTTPQPLLGQITATMRFDLDDRGTTQHWYVEIDKGTIGVSEREDPADATIRTHRSLFDRMVTGEANAMAATLRGQVGIDGDRGLLVAFQRVFPGPARANAAVKGASR